MCWEAAAAEASLTRGLTSPAPATAAGAAAAAGQDEEEGAADYLEDEDAQPVDTSAMTEAEWDAHELQRRKRRYLRDLLGEVKKVEGKWPTWELTPWTGGRRVLLRCRPLVMNADDVAARVDGRCS